MTGTGTNTKTVPLATNVSPGEAIQRLQELGFGVAFAAPKSGFAKDVVITQTPVAGTLALTGSTVTLTAGAGEVVQQPGNKSEIVPLATGVKQQAAIDILQAKEFGVAFAPPKCGFEKELVIAQNPPAGDLAPLKSDVKLTVGSGPAREEARAADQSGLEKKAESLGSC